jgi:para-nitrobenzyl esterase
MIVRPLFFLISWVLLARPAGAGTLRDSVRVAGGFIAGTTTADGAVRIFKGVPFAAPPVGTLRWRAPQPVVPWTGVRDCTHWGPSPVQGPPAPFSMWSAEFLIPPAPISEDCLYLNVWTNAPAAPDRSPGRPVLVWIYGGGFNSGGSAVPIYDGEALARRGIVFVSVNYRVGPLGFLAHPELTQESGQGASGNYGLMDHLAALRWVRQHIARFGGDPERVTIAGQSAGSMSVSCLVASPQGRGLFQQAIAQSGASFRRSLPSLAEAETAGLAFMRAAGAASLAELRQQPAADLLRHASALRGGPIIDGAVLPEAVPALFEAGRQNPVRLLTGWNQDEGLLFGPVKTAAQYRQQLEKDYGPRAPVLLGAYPGTTDAEAARSQLELSRDQLFGVPNYTWASHPSQQRQPVYVYRFTRAVPARGTYAAYGAFHTGEVAYAYDNLRFIDRDLRPLNATDEALARTMTAYWTNFIKTGTPNGPGLPDWPRYTTKTRQIMELGDRVRAQPLPDAARLDTLRTLLTTP